MAAKRIFVGRKVKLEQFTKALEDLRGQTILIGGRADMGETRLVNKLAEVTEPFFSPKISHFGQLRR
jgi:hypothetical protein